jgi:anti-sigma factor RsiW
LSEGEKSVSLIIGTRGNTGDSLSSSSIEYMREHLSRRELELYGARRLPPAERWAFDEHLAECPACRVRAAGVTHAEERFESLLNDFEQTASAPLEHLDFGQIAGFVDDAMNETERIVVADHLAVCASCVHEVRELSAFRVSLETHSPNETAAEARRSEPVAPGVERPGMFGRLFGLRGLFSPLTAGAAALLLLSVAGLFWLTRSDDAPASRPEIALGGRPSTPNTAADPSAEERAQARGGQAATGERAGAVVSGSDARNGKESVPADPSKRQEGERDDVLRARESPASPGSESTAARRTTRPAIVAALNDSGKRVALDAAGNLVGFEQLPESDRRAIKSALASGRVSTPPALAGLTAGGGPLLGGGGGQADDGGIVFAPLTPVGTVVRAVRPSFKWGTLEGATSYVVNVYDTSFNKVATSGALSGTEWTPPAGALAHGRVYAWQVTASRGSEEITAPAPDAPEARFKVLEDVEARELDAAQRVAGDSHLALGVIYARAGLLEEAEREFRLLLEENPASVTAQKLLRDLRARRRPRTPER